jgi:hypothetical protein
VTHEDLPLLKGGVMTTPEEKVLEHMKLMCSEDLDVLPNFCADAHRDMKRIVEVVKAARAYRDNDTAADDLGLYTALDNALEELEEK